METALALRAVCDQRGLVLMIGADDRLAAAAGADGVHLPERLLWRAKRLRAKWPLWRITGAAHSRRALALAKAVKLDAALLSPVFPSRSPSAKRPLGPTRFALLARGAGLPVYALGGVNARTAPRVLATRAAGLAAVEGVAGGPLATKAPPRHNFPQAHYMLWNEALTPPTS